ncbi:hypothetical protein [Actinomadura hibisca]|uniref:hypothetical protein n=1 Tax=Actinomadura hibisca TaxID=68565 RepID=UPI00082D180E|nr:hypothetical protein [Actinomadura hibisca]
MFWNASPEARTAALCLYDAMRPRDQRDLADPDMSDADLITLATELVARVTDPTERQQLLTYWQQLSQ